MVKELGLLTIRPPVPLDIFTTLDLYEVICIHVFDLLTIDNKIKNSGTLSNL